MFKPPLKTALKAQNLTEIITVFTRFFTPLGTVIPLHFLPITPWFKAGLGSFWIFLIDVAHR